MKESDYDWLDDRGLTLADVADEDTPQRVECHVCDGSLGNHCWKCHGKGWVLELPKEDD